MKDFRPVRTMISIFTALSLFSACSLTAYAGDKPTVEELQERIIELEKQVAECKELLKQYGQVCKTEDRDISKKIGKGAARKGKKLYAMPAIPGNFTIGGNITGIVQGSPNSKVQDEHEQSKIGGSYQANFTLANKFEEVNGMALANLRVDQGSGLEDRLTVYSNVDNNVWRPETIITLSEIFYQQSLFDDKLTVNFGKLDPTVWFDKNRYANSDPTQFLARIFNNSPVIEFPVNSGGIRAAFTPYDWLEAGGLIMSGHADLSDLESNLFYTGKIAFKTKIDEKEGNYRFLGWLNTNHHTKWLDTSENKENSYGFSVSCDQEITDYLGIFGKFGWQNPGVYNPSTEANIFSFGNTTPNAGNFSLEYMWSAGLQVEGDLWGREHDFCGLAVAQAIPSHYMKKALENTADSRKARNEGHLEAYYNFYINKYLAVSPGVQLILYPYGSDAGGDDVVQVYTIRTHVDF